MSGAAFPSPSSTFVMLSHLPFCLIMSSQKSPSSCFTESYWPHFFFLNDRALLSHEVAQARTCDPAASGFQSARIIDVCHGT